MTENEHGDSGSLVGARQLEAEGVIKQVSPPRAIMKLETWFLLIFLAAVTFIFGSQYLHLKKRTDAIYAYNEGARLRKERRWDQAIPHFDKAIELDLKLAAAFVGRAQSNSFLGRYEQAIQDYDVAIRLEPGKPGLYLERGNTYHGLGDPKRAIKDFDKVIAIGRSYEHYAWTYVFRGTSYRNLGQHEQAIRDFSSAIRIDPRLASAYVERGVTYLKQGKASEAQTDFRKAREFSKGDSMASEGVESAIARAKQEEDERIK